MVLALFNRSTDPLALAIRSLRLLAILNLILGATVIIVRGVFNRYTLYRHWFLAGGLVLWLIPGLLYLVMIPPLRLRKLSAIVFALVIAGFQCACAVAVVAANLVLRPISPLPLLLSIFWILAMVELLLRLRQVFIRRGIEQQRGFEPLPGSGHFEM